MLIEQNDIYNNHGYSFKYINIYILCFDPYFSILHTVRIVLFNPNKNWLAPALIYNKLFKFN